MNNGKICVSVCAETAGEFIENTGRAESIADVIELRFDCLAESELENALEKTCRLKTGKPLLLAFRPKEQGGRRDLSKKEREFFWCSGYDFCANWADVEPDLIETASHWLFEKLICSYHDFNGVPGNLDEIYENLKMSDADVLKIAVQASNIADTIAVWKLLEKARKDNKQIVPIAMSEAGKWTRILGLAHGALMTYAALETGKETASGQLTAQDLIEIYRVKELDKQTEVYGIIGNPVSHSLSPYIHNTAFKFHNLNAVFVPFEVNDLDEFIKKFVREETREVELNFKGFAVTIPHKQQIIRHLDSIDETARKIGAVNTVKIVDGKLHGFNTDAAGFIKPLKNVFGDLRDARVAVFGSGGAARACVYALKQESATVTIFARNFEKAKLLAEEFSADYKLPVENYDPFDIVINTTPLGMKGANENETPLAGEQIKNVSLVYDLVYTPFETRLLREARNIGVPTLGGFAMLIAQAMEQFKIWTNLDAPMQEISRGTLRKLNQ